ncbi:hypothetical protein ACQY0O_008248 [Thecaphora frezii]
MERRTIIVVGAGSIRGAMGQRMAPHAPTLRYAEARWGGSRGQAALLWYPLFPSFRVIVALPHLSASKLPNAALQSQKRPRQRIAYFGGPARRDADQRGGQPRQISDVLVSL